MIHFLDEFEAANGALLADHSPNVGASWTLYFTEPEALVIQDGALRRPTFGEDAGNCFGSAYFYSQTSMPTTPFVVEYTLRFAEGNYHGEIEFARNGDGLTNDDKFVTITYQGPETPSDITSFGEHVSYSGFNQYDTPYLIRHEFSGDGYRMLIDGAEIISVSEVGPAWWSGLFGGVLYDNDGEARIRVDRLLIESEEEDPPAPPSGGGLVYPSSLPCPRAADITAAERRLLGQQPARQARTIQRDRHYFQNLEWIFTLPQAEAFQAWFETDLESGGALFEADWPHPLGGAAVRKFVGAPTWGYVAGGFWRVSALCEVQGRIEPPQRPGGGNGGSSIGWFAPATDYDPSTAATTNEGFLDEAFFGDDLYGGVIGAPIEGAVAWSTTWDPVFSGDPQPVFGDYGDGTFTVRPEMVQDENFFFIRVSAGIWSLTAAGYTGRLQLAISFGGDGDTYADMEWTWHAT